jgi:hypothetical protein
MLIKHYGKAHREPPTIAWLSALRLLPNGVATPTS